MEQFGVKLWIRLLKICKKNFFFFNKDTQANRLGIITNQVPGLSETSNT